MTNSKRTWLKILRLKKNCRWFLNFPGNAGECHGSADVTFIPNILYKLTKRSWLGIDRRQVKGTNLTMETGTFRKNIQEQLKFDIVEDFNTVYQF